MSVLVFVVIFFQGTIQVVGEVVDEVFKGFSWVEKVFLLRVAFGFDVCLGFGRYSYQVPCQKEVFLDDFGWVPSWNECVPTISIKWLRKPNLILIYGKKKDSERKQRNRLVHTSSFSGQPPVDQKLQAAVDEQEIQQKKIKFAPFWTRKSK